MIQTALEAIVGAAVVLALAYVFSSPPAWAVECQEAKVSWYGHQHHGRKTASGEVFNQWGSTAAMVGRKHIGEVWRVTSGKRSVVVRVNDTGGFAKYGRLLDLSRGAFRRIADEDKGVIRVQACRLR